MTLRTVIKNFFNFGLGVVGLEIKSKEKQVKVGLSVSKQKNDPYLWLKRSKIKTILDIGANTGQFAAKIRTIFPHAEIISFEPLADCFDELIKNGPSLGKFRAYNYALGNQDGQAPIYRSEFSPSSSLLPMGVLHKEAFPFTKRGSVEEIEVRKLDGIKDLKIFKPALIKIDVQGFEDKVIEGGKKTIKQADIIIVETSFKSLYEGQPIFDKIYQQLTSLGFTYRGNWGQLEDVRDGTILQADAIFIKSGTDDDK